MIRFTIRLMMNFLNWVINYLLKSPILKAKLSAPNDAEISFKFFDGIYNEILIIKKLNEDFSNLSHIFCFISPSGCSNIYEIGKRFQLFMLN